MKPPHAKTFLYFFTLILFFFAHAPDSPALSAINCHCFKDRTYNPANPFAADDYILATSFNSLMSNAFGIPKKEIITLKMKEGFGQDDLLVGMKIAQITGADLRQLLSLRRKKQPWSAIISDLTRQGNPGNDEVLETIRAGSSVEHAGAAVADELIAGFYKVPTEAIQKYRIHGLNEKELALLFILAHAGGQEPQTLFERRSKEGKSWSEIADDLGIEPAAAGKLILHYPAKQLPR